MGNKFLKAFVAVLGFVALARADGPIVESVMQGGPATLSTTTITGPTSIQGISFPTTPGVGGYYLQTNGLNQASWQPIVSSTFSGNSTLQVLVNGVQISSPTAAIGFTNNLKGVFVAGATAQIDLNPNTTYFIWNTGTPQAAALSVTTGTFSLISASSNTVLPGTTFYQNGTIVFGNSGSVITIPVLSTGSFVQTNASRQLFAGPIQTSALPTTVAILNSTQTFSGGNVYSSSVTLNGPLLVNNNPGTSGYVLTTQGPNLPPQWAVSTASGAVILLQSSLQSGATFFVSSGTVSGAFLSNNITATSNLTVGTAGSPLDGNIQLTLSGSTYTVVSSSFVPTVGNAVIWTSTKGTLGNAGGGAGAPSGNPYDVQVSSPNGLFAGYDNLQNNGQAIGMYSVGSILETNLSSETARNVTFDYTSSSLTISALLIANQIQTSDGHQMMSGFNTSGCFSAGYGSGLIRPGTCSGDTYVGYGTGNNNGTDPGNNTAVGASALSGVTGQFNTAVGADDILLSESGNDNTAIGSNQWSNTGGSQSDNTTVGFQIFTAGTNPAVRNTIVGSNAFVNGTTASSNTVVGYGAGYGIDLSSSAVSDSGNTWLGYEAGKSTSAVITNSIAIGYGAVVSSSNTAVIGNASTVYVGISGSVGLPSYSHATLQTITPFKQFEEVGCTDCSTVPVCISTGTLVGSWSLITSKASACQ